MMSKVCIITGGNSGIGFEVCKKLLALNYHVILGCRDTAKAEQAVKDLQPYKTTESILETMSIDLSQFDTIRQFAKDFSAKNLPLHLLINNAGLFANIDNKFTEENIELVLATNYFGQFLLTQLLLEHLKKTEKSRIVNVSSALYKRTNLEIPITSLNPIDDRNMRLKGAYPFSKYLGLLSTVKFNQKYQNPTITSVCPGFIPSTNLKRDSTLFIKALMYFIFPFLSFTSTIDQGVDRVIEAAHRPIGELPKKDGEGCWIHEKEEWNWLTFDQDKVDELWDHSMKTVGLQE